MKFYTVYILFVLFISSCGQSKTSNADKNVQQEDLEPKKNHQALQAQTLGHQQSPINIPSEYRCKYSQKHLIGFH